MKTQHSHNHHHNSNANLIRLLALAAFSFTFIFIIFSASIHETADDLRTASSSTEIPVKTVKNDEIKKVSSIISSSSSSSSVHFDPSLRGKFRSDIRTGETFMGTAVSYSDLMFNNFSTFCNHGPGTVRCSLSMMMMNKNKKKTRWNSVNNNNSSSSNHYSSPCCSCSWTPLARSCTGPFNQSNIPLMKRVLFAHYVHTPTSHAIPSIKNFGQIACPMFDKGQWRLPEKFLDFNNIDDATRASLSASILFSSSSFGRQKDDDDDYNSNEFLQQRQQQRREQIEHEKQNRKNIGPLLVWKLGRELRKLKSHKGVFVRNKNTSSTGESNLNRTTTETNTDDTNEQHEKIPFESPGLLIISGDSMIRQLFMRLIHAIRSKECSTENEMFRGGVFERYYHLSAGYVVTTKGDALELGFDSGCERVAREAYESTLVHDGGRVLLRICYVWDPKNDPSEQGRESTVGAIETLSKLTPIAGVIYWPTIHGCTTETGNCADANVSNAAAFRVYSSALEHHVPRVVVSSSVMRHWYPYYHWDVVGERNAQLKSYFPENMFEKVRKFLDEDGILKFWRESRTRREKWVNNYDLMMKELVNSIKTKHKSWMNMSAKASAKDNLEKYSSSASISSFESSSSTRQKEKEEPLETSSLYLATKNGRFRFYDHASRHKQAAPRQCDHGHSMCMFFPQRISRGRSKQLVNGMSGICPNGSRCEDPWNFLFIHELLALLMA